MWSPDSSRIAYTNFGGVWVVGADGAGAKRLESEGSDPVWSPDGSRIVFRDHDGCLGCGR